MKAWNVAVEERDALRDAAMDLYAILPADRVHLVRETTTAALK